MQRWIGPKLALIEALTPFHLQIMQVKNCRKISQTSSIPISLSFLSCQIDHMRIPQPLSANTYLFLFASRPDSRSEVVDLKLFDISTLHERFAYVKNEKRLKLRNCNSWISYQEKIIIKELCVISLIVTRRFLNIFQ